MPELDYSAAIVLTIAAVIVIASILRRGGPGGSGWYPGRILAGILTRPIVILILIIIVLINLRNYF